MSQRLVGYCLLVVVASVSGGLLPLMHVITHVRMQIYLSFAAGVMLGSALLHMLPESAEIGGPGVVAWALPGLLTLFMIERFFSYHTHEFELDVVDDQTLPRIPAAGLHAHVHSDACGAHEHHSETAGDRAFSHGSGASKDAARYQWKAAAVGLALHSLLGGVALASAEKASGTDSWTISGGVFLATLLHKPADALTITSLMRRGGVRPRFAHLVNFLFALMIPLGALGFAIGESRLDVFHFGTIETFTGAALAFSAGTFLCIALSDLLPELHFHSHDRFKLSFSLLAGVAIMAVVAVFGE